jgi:thioredoxin reductase (NADPH)
VILAVDDEAAVSPPSRATCRRGCGQRLRVMRASSGRRRWTLLRQAARAPRGRHAHRRPADPSMAGTEHLVEARKLVPEAKRLLTA